MEGWGILSDGETLYQRAGSELACLDLEAECAVFASDFTYYIQVLN